MGPPPFELLGRHLIEGSSDCVKIVDLDGRVVLAVFKDPAGNSVGLVELENGKAKVPPAPKP